MIVATRRLEFDAGHRLLNHEGKCKHLHGHRYAAEIAVTADKLDPLGRVIDFSVIKQIVGGWIDANWDHNLLLNPQDPLLKFLRIADRQAAQQNRLMTNSAIVSAEVFDNKTPFIMPKGAENPTAENLGEVLHVTASELLKGFSIIVARVRLYETPNCWTESFNG